MEQPLVQILVVVASIQMRTLKAEVEKGSVRTAIGHGLVDPKALGNSVQKVAGWRRDGHARLAAPPLTAVQAGPATGRKGIRLIFRNQSSDTGGAPSRARRRMVATQLNLETPAGALGRVLFSF